jgi:soluble P-type ATPase
LRATAARWRKRLRASLPTREHGTCAGIAVPPAAAAPRKPLDRLRGLDTPEASSFEGALASVHREHTRPGDRVVVVGGGFGVTTVAAARAGASVTVYEASADRLAALRRTLRLNGVDAERVTLRQAVVGELAEAEAAEKGLNTDVPTVAPADLPDCDVLELDCEGAERTVLEGLSATDSRPRLVAVEVHPIKLGGSPGEVLDLLDSMGYEPVEWLTHDGAAITREQFERLLAGETPEVTGPDHQEFPPVVVAER